jgi:hypothetical protein
MEPDITWYDVLGALPDAETRKIKQKYEGKAALLRPELISGAPPTCSRRSRGRSTSSTPRGKCSAIRTAASATTRRPASGVQAGA